MSTKINTSSPKVIHDEVTCDELDNRIDISMIGILDLNSVDGVNCSNGYGTSGGWIRMSAPRFGSFAYTDARTNPYFYPKETFENPATASGYSWLSNASNYDNYTYTDSRNISIARNVDVSFTDSDKIIVVTYSGYGFDGHHDVQDDGFLKDSSTHNYSSTVSHILKYTSSTRTISRIYTNMVFPMTRHIMPFYGAGRGWYYFSTGLNSPSGPVPWKASESSTKISLPMYGDDISFACGIAYSGGGCWWYAGILSCMYVDIPIEPQVSNSVVTFSATLRASATKVDDTDGSTSVELSHSSIVENPEKFYDTMTSGSPLPNPTYNWIMIQWESI